MRSLSGMVVLMASLAFSQAIPANVWAGLPTGLIFVSRSANGALTVEGVDVPGAGIRLERASRGKLQLVADTVSGTRTAWAEEVTKNAAGQWQTANVPVIGRIIFALVPPEGAWIFLLTGFAISGKTVIFESPPPAGVQVLGFYLF